MKALKREAKILKKGDSKVTSRQKDRHKMGLGKRGFWTALNSLTGEEIFQKTRLSPGGNLQLTFRCILQSHYYRLLSGPPGFLLPAPTALLRWRKDRSIHRDNRPGRGLVKLVYWLPCPLCICYWRSKSVFVYSNQNAIDTWSMLWRRIKLIHSDKGFNFDITSLINIFYSAATE